MSLTNLALARDCPRCHHCGDFAVDRRQLFPPSWERLLKNMAIMQVRFLDWSGAPLTIRSTRSDTEREGCSLEGANGSQIGKTNVMKVFRHKPRLVRLSAPR